MAIEYLAGFVDGEGSIGLARNARAKLPSPEFCARVSIANSNRQILEDIRQDYGGCLAEWRAKNPIWKPGHALIWTNAAAIQLLRQLAPHLRIKVDQSAALLEFAEHVGECRRKRDRYGRLLPLTRAELAIREAFYCRLRRLNLRGPQEVEYQSDEGADQGSRILKSRRVAVQYLAGFVDGEGSLMIAKTRVRKYGTTQYRARLTVHNTDRRVLEQIRRDYGGLIYRERRVEARWKDCYVLVWTCGMIPHLLSLLRPHLRIKRRQAEVLLDLIRHVRETPMNRKGKFWIPHPKSVIDFRERLYQRVKALNARGVQPADT